MFLFLRPLAAATGPTLSSPTAVTITTVSAVPRVTLTFP